MSSHLTSLQPLISQAGGPLQGDIAVPGDKSISHRSLILGSTVIGSVTVRGMLEGDDVLGTMRALQHLGVTISRHDNGEWRIQGRGIGGLNEPGHVLDMGNSGTSVRLLMGLLAPYPYTTFFSGDESLSRRPMKRVITPLSEMGAQVTAHSGHTLPLAITGSATLKPITYTLPVASAQVKSAILLAGLNTPGRTTVIEPIATRDHTERMMKHLGIALTIVPHAGGGVAISIEGHQKQTHQDTIIDVPGDPSSAAFPLVAALLVPGSEITVRHICMNPLRTGLFDVLGRMGADITYSNARDEAGEPVADITARHSTLKAVDVEAAIAPSMIDEYPVLAIAAAFAQGTSTMRGLSELRVKESDRLQAIIDGLAANGVQAEAEGDTLIVHGTGGHAASGPVQGGGNVTTHFDHRIAMAFLIMGLASQQPVVVDDGRAIATSFPNFTSLMSGCGAHILRERRTHRRIARRHPFVIAIDGPAASGKGTLGRRLSEALGLPYLDTGSLYRAVGMRVLFSGNDPHDKAHAIEAAKSITPEDFTNPQLRYEKVGQAASIVSAMPEIRAILLDFQRKFTASPQGAILDGRDIGTVVCPQADLKLFMTASLEARASRRHRQLQDQGIEVVYDSVLRDLIERDARDQQRKNAPLVAAPDAVTIDTTSMNANEVFDKMLKIIESQPLAV